MTSAQAAVVYDDRKAAAITFARDMLGRIRKPLE